MDPPRAPQAPPRIPKDPPGPSQDPPRDPQGPLKLNFKHWVCPLHNRMHYKNQCIRAKMASFQETCKKIAKNMTTSMFAPLYPPRDPRLPLGPSLGSPWAFLGPSVDRAKGPQSPGETPRGPQGSPRDLPGTPQDPPRAPKDHLVRPQEAPGSP